MNIAVIGIGVMGEPMARNMLKAGLQVMVYNRSPQRCAGLRDAGAVLAQNSAEAIECCDTIVLMLPGHREIDDVLGRDTSGRIGARIQDKTVVMMATVAPEYSRALASDVASCGARYVEAPVSGSRTPAEQGQLVVLAAANCAEDVEAVQPIFDAVGKRTVRCGAVPRAMRMKLANNLLLIAFMEAITEATHFARGMNLDAEQFMQMALAGPLANDVMRVKAPKLLNDDFAQQAAIRHVSKDIGLICDEAEAQGLWLPIARANRNLFDEAMERGLEDDDAVGIVKLLRSGAAV